MRPASQKDLEVLKRIEKCAYPSAYRQMQDLESLDDLEDYCEGSPYVLTWETGYCLVTRDEIVDLAATARVSMKQLLTLARALREFYGNRTFSLDAREKTSLKLIRFMARRGGLELLDMEVWEWAGERFWEIRCRFSG